MSNISPAKLAANRRNALKSTGPRTAAGKRISSRNTLKATGPRTAAGKQRVSLNALKHGLRARNPYDDMLLPQVLAPAFEDFRRQLKSTLAPRTALQHTLFPQIVNVAWKLRDLPAAQNLLFQFEREHIPGHAHIFAPELIARRCSDDPNNGFLLLNRYERSIENAFIRLLKSFQNACDLERRQERRFNQQTEPKSCKNPSPVSEPAISADQAITRISQQTEPTKNPDP
jgi:hypothetical protein